MTELLSNDVVALAVAALALLKIVVRLTPTEKDNKIVAFVEKAFNFFLPNRTKK